MGETVVIPARYNGPPDSGNGGYSAGVVAAVLGGGPAEVTLKAPPPLDRPLHVQHSDELVVVSEGDTTVALAMPTTVDLDPPSPVSYEEAASVAELGPYHDAAHHPFPTCFVCGPERLEDDGLRIFPGPVGDGSLFAAAWTPSPELADPDGRLPDEVVWAALDCPTSAPVANDPGSEDFLPVVLARLAVRIDRPPVAGDRHVVMAWPRKVEGRKREAAAALYAEDGAVCGVSRALWIELRSA